MSFKAPPYTGETAGLVDGIQYHQTDRSTRVYWNDPQLARITRLRLLSDPGHPVWDVSYCHGKLKDGTACTVELPFDVVPKGKVSAYIVQEAKKDGVYAKRLGILSAISTLI